ncbi:MAG: hypothetical protein HQK73_00475 [Desulfamplus sp.]|nr:hypothetical protein [Desulfamplus sp.]MBF0412189.1 hypothetical protein [Desulfamplus sp.]
MKDAEKQIFERLSNLYTKMDRAWDKTASLYGFKCNGCDENCCETEFYHHTLVEKAYLLKAFDKLPVPAVIAAKKRAQKVCTKRDIAAKKGESIRVMCPLNQDGKCILYNFRPMICRLHGIPHEILKPSQSSVSSSVLPPSLNSIPNPAVLNPGCKVGYELFNASGYIKFDRTPFYSEMAAIEKDYLTKVIGRVTRIRQTIAQMLVKQQF